MNQNAASDQGFQCTKNIKYYGLFSSKYMLPLDTIPFDEGYKAVELISGFFCFCSANEQLMLQVGELFT